MPVVRYTYASQGRLVAENRGGVTSLYQQDSQGTTSRLLTSDGGVSDTFQYTANGIEISQSGTNPTPFLWLGSQGAYLPSGPSTAEFTSPPWCSGIIWDPTGGMPIVDFGTYIRPPDWNGIWEGIDGLVEGALDGGFLGGGIVVVLTPPPIPNPGPTWTPPPPISPPPVQSPPPAPILIGRPARHRRPPIGDRGVGTGISILNLWGCLGLCALQHFNPLPIEIDKEGCEPGWTNIGHRGVEGLTGTGDGVYNEPIVEIPSFWEAVSSKIPIVEDAACLSKCLLDLMEGLEDNEDNIAEWRRCNSESTEIDCLLCCTKKAGANKAYCSSACNGIDDED